MESLRRALIFLTFTIIISGLFHSCAGGPVPNTDEKRGELTPEENELLNNYEEAIRTRNPELLESILTEEAAIRFRERSGNRTDIGGTDAIAEFLLVYFQDFGPQEEYRLNKLIMVEGDRTNNQLLLFAPRESGGSELIHLQKQDGRWKINIIEIHLHQPGEWVTNRYQALTDYDRNGFLDVDERQELENFTFGFYEGPHEIRTPVDEFFDLNRNGFVDEEEIRYAGEIHYVLGPRFFAEVFPWDPVIFPVLDLNRDGEVADEELVQVWEYMTGGPEIPAEREELIRLNTIAFYPDAVYLTVPRDVDCILDELADGNADGIIDEVEQALILESLAPAQKQARNDLERAIDRNRDGIVDETDIFLALQDSALRRGMVSAGAEPPYEARTAIDRMLDRMGDGHVDGDDIEIAVLVLAGNTEQIRETSPAFQNILDWNRDDRLEAWEIEEAKGLLLFPRPVDPGRPLDLELDTNGDKFIDPEELGITAGLTNKGEIPPFEERIAIVRNRSNREQTSGEDRNSNAVSASATPGSEFYLKLGTIQDKKLAVVTLDVGTEKVDEETANGVIVFVENAFVNVGKVKVVDRAHIKEVFNEVEFQSTGVIDESTAVEIGKLSGADIIVIGSINRVGGLFYLNIKLITVQTAEIIGSSISQARDATEFLEMANQAVYNLF